MDDKPEYETDWGSELNEILGITPHPERKTNRRVFYWVSAGLIILLFLIGYVYQVNVVTLLPSRLKAGFYWFADYCNLHSKQLFF